MEVHKYASWNIRGANSIVSRNLIKGFVTKTSPAVCCLQETKCRNWSQSEVRTLGMGDSVGWSESPAMGLSGGLITFWDKDKILVTESKVSRYWVLIKGTCKTNGTPFACFNVYAPQLLAQKKLVWDEISAISSSLGDISICQLGDFNAVCHDVERLSCKATPTITEAFNRYIDNLGMVDIPLVGSKYTWYGPKGKRGRLDRALLSVTWFGSGNWHLEAMNRHLSDHRPILLTNSISDWGPRPFKFFNCWLEDISLVGKMKKVWKESPATNVQHKFKSLRAVAKEWNKHKLGNIDLRIKEAESIRDKGDVEGEHPSVPNVAPLNLESLYRIKSSMLCQKSKLNWQLNGEKNTRLFHRAIAKRKSKNSITSIMVGSTVYTTPSDIKHAFFNHFKNLLAKGSTTKVFEFGPELAASLKPSQSSSMEAIFTLQEIEAALSSTDKTKAPGPDGTNAGVLSSIWPEIKNEVLAVFNTFYESGELPEGLNSSFIALIPKTKSALSPADFRPISLMNSLMKLITKVLATRLKACMPSLVSPVQSAFIKKRQITDSILLTNEVVNMLQKGLVKGVVFKIDFEKAFDSIGWNYVYEVLKKMKFGSRWVKWIKSIFESSRISVLVNGNPTKEFSPCNGLRQGDPLSPLLFNLVGETLSFLINQGVKENICKGILLPGSAGVISHLQFADDVILFLNADESSLYGIKRILQCFQLLSGLKINFSKSQVFCFGNNSAASLYSPRILGCMLGSIPFKYLGATIGSSPRSLSFWNPLVQKIRAKIESFNAQNISVAGRLVLLKAAIDSVPAYWFSLYRLPASIIKLIERIRCSFFWGHASDNTSKKLHLLSWNKICQSKEFGGLGLASIRDRNVALLAKWWWRAFSERNVFWNNILTHSYGHSWTYNLGDIPINKASYIVKNIVSVKNHPAVGSFLVRSKFRWVVQSGTSILFWEDIWHQNDPLCLLFPELYVISAFKHSTLACMLRAWRQDADESGLWLSAPPESLQSHIFQITQIIISVHLNSDRDKPIWLPANGPYSSKVGYQTIKKTINNSAPNVCNIKWSLIWSAKIPPRIRTFLWKISWGILPTRLFLSNRIEGIESKCQWCNAPEESLTHLFWECSLPIFVWKFLGEWWSVKHLVSRDLHFSFQKLFSLKNSKYVVKVWHTVVAASLWTIWLARNELLFKGTRLTNSTIKHLILVRVSKWGRASGLMNFGEDPIWKVNPIGLLHVHNRKASESFWKIKRECFDVVCMVDAAWGINNQGLTCGGVGGSIFCKSGKLVYCFSGQVFSFSALESEVMALLHILSVINSSCIRTLRTVVCSDSAEAINSIYNGLATTFPLLIPNFSINHLLNNGTNIHFVPSELNDNADCLAKSGLNRERWAVYWDPSKDWALPVLGPH